MSDFYSTTTIRATRKRHVCEHCLTAIAIGSPATRQAGMWDGDFFSDHVHPECQEASIAHRTMCGLMDGVGSGEMGLAA